MNAVDTRNTMGAIEQDTLWSAVQSRNAGRDGAFVFAVRTTGVYCRPSCPSRRPRRENVAFYPDPRAAEREGYRACRRCRPDEAAFDPRAALVREACRLIDGSEATPTLSGLAARLGRNPHYLQRAFKRTMGISPRQYAEARKIDRFRAGVGGRGTVTGALYTAGFGSSSRLYERAASHLGMTPATYGRRGRGATIAWTIAPCSLGRLLVAATPSGLCAVRLGDADRDLARELREEFAAATLIRDEKVLGPVVKALLGHLDGAAPPRDFPLDVRATAFQRLVWERLRRIPPGERRTYAGIAAEAGRPGASRAVARAIATNPAAVVIPCHRVIRSDGGLAGYRWGVKRKKALLKREEVRSRGSEPSPPPRPSPTRTS